MLLINKLQKKYLSRTSETTRKDTLHTTTINQWLAGFLEGDGHFNLGRVTIIINQTDITVFKYIRKMFNCGTMTGPYYNYKTVNGEKEISCTYYRFIISGEQAVGFIINSLNGKILLDHTYLKFEQFVGAYNVKYPNNTIECLPKASAQDLINWDSAWLSGFVDAEGCFNIQTKLKHRFIVDQANEEAVLREVISLFTGTVTVRTKSKNNINSPKTYYRYVCQNQAGILSVIKYMDKYNLHSSKWRDYLKWKNSFQAKIASSRRSKV